MGVDLQLRRPRCKMQGLLQISNKQIPSRSNQIAASISIQTVGSVLGCCKFPLSRLMKSNVFDCSQRNFNACAWKLDTAIVQLGSIMCNQERTKGPPKDYVAVVIPGPLLFPFVLVFRCLVISCHNVLFSFFASYGIRISLRSTVTMSYEFI